MVKVVRLLFYFISGKGMIDSVFILSRLQEEYMYLDKEKKIVYVLH